MASEKQTQLVEKYKDIDGACEWFQHKKLEIEQTQKKANLSAS